MKLNLDIKAPSSQEWINAVMSDFDSFLQDHLDCERKASSMAMSFVAKYPDRKEIIPDLIETGIEELEHFQQVYLLMEKRGIPLPHSMGEDPYVKALIKKCHSGREERFLDRLLIASIVETRGAERFKMVADALEDPELKKFYKMLWTSEAKHGHIFVKMALNYFSKDQVYQRLEWWVDQEQEILDGLEIRAALH
ncbi:tRNA-(ms[2]io[6]A)-hydroxylase [Portibacter marinus]|uniref:tRNA-(ms[2]io[6]A)-hydroxylase n=1 Tax=Portibacter marinus TaxID=2898660 RepID=UPI001F385A3F|nr:tRNA-(ms[2]io[6]A)-hydroxylase [Portibacter marinus]